MRKYEIMFVVKPDVPEEEVAKFITQMESVATGAGGAIEKVEKMGRRRLAYRIARQREGFYILFVVDGSGEMVKEFERRLKVSDAVIKFMSVRVDEELARAAKVKEIRATRDARRPRSKPPAAASPTPAQAEPTAG